MLTAVSSVHDRDENEEGKRRRSEETNLHKCLSSATPNTLFVGMRRSVNKDEYFFKNISFLDSYTRGFGDGRETERKKLIRKHKDFISRRTLEKFTHFKWHLDN